MRKIFLIALSLLLSFSLISCGEEADQNSKRRFSGDRVKMEKTGKRNRGEKRGSKQNRRQSKTSPAPQQPAPKKRPAPKKDLPFPFSLKTSHSALFIESVGDSSYKSSISAEPADVPVKALAGIKGRLSLQSSNGVYTVIVSSNKKKIYFELDEKKTKLLAKEGQTVTPAQALAETTGPVLFYVKKGEELTALCFSVNQSLEKGALVVTNNFKYHPNCDNPPK